MLRSCDFSTLYSGKGHDEMSESVSREMSLLYPRSGECDVWILPLDCDDARTTASMTMLTPAERVRANAFKVSPPRHRFVQTRAALRLLLGACLNVDASLVGIEQDAGGKPSTPERPDCQFNVSHSGVYALLAIGHGHELGVDIECQRETGDLDLLASNVLSPGEQAVWHALPEVAKLPAFFSLWTKKEALSKALGLGIALPFHTLDIGVNVVLEPVAEGPQLVSVPDYGSCKLYPLSLPSGYSGALAIRQPH